MFLCTGARSHNSENETNTNLLSRCVDEKYGLSLATNARSKIAVVYISAPLEVLVHYTVSVYQRITDIESRGCYTVGRFKGRIDTAEQLLCRSHVRSGPKGCVSYDSYLRVRT